VRATGPHPGRPGEQVGKPTGLERAEETAEIQAFSPERSGAGVEPTQRRLRRLTGFEESVRRNPKPLDKCITPSRAGRRTTAHATAERMPLTR
jgi:hypothetical protein